MNRRLIIYILLALVLIMALVILRVSINETPEVEINRARKKLFESESQGSSQYASKTYQSARMYYDSAMIAWREQNQRLIIFRDYEKTIEFALHSEELSDAALEATEMKIAATEQKLGLRIAMLEYKIAEFESRYGNFPFESKDRNEITKSKILLDEGILAYKKLNYMTCKTKLDSVELVINRLHEIYKQKLVAYFNEYVKWDKWVEQSISKSRNNKAYCIIIDKYTRECTLYKNGKVQHIMDVELGDNWIGDKIQQGDKATPEGLYKIISKKSNGATKFHKAFLLDYPNEDDKKRFITNKKNGLIKQDAKIGNLIEIHGNGGKGIDWTNGCIALKDVDMDLLFAACPESTTVTIVGSVKPLNDLYPDL